MNARIVSLLGSSLFVATTASAHHGFGTFDMNADVEFTGVITSLDFVNPHSWLHFEVTNPDGTKTQRRCELRSATTLRRSGWSPELFPVGTTITIEGSPDRTDPNACYVSTIIFQDGSSLDRYGQRIEATVTTERVARLPNGELNISGDWAQEQRIMTDPKGRDGTLVALSQANDFGVGGVPEGQREIAGARGTAEAQTVRDPNARPAPRPVVGLTEAGTAAMQVLVDTPRAVRSCSIGSVISDWAGEPVNRITQRMDTITMQYGFLGLERIIRMGVEGHPTQIEPSRAGHSIGRWDGDVLVVDTVGFLPGTLRGVTPHSDQMHVVERFSIDTATMMLKRDYTVDDPAYFTETYTGSDTMQLSAVPYAPEPCEDLTPTAPPAP